MAISSFGSADAAEFPEADYFQHFKGGKWDGIYAFFAAFPHLLEEFDTFWLPDDDIDATPSDIERMFQLFDEYELELAQPSLSRDSYFAYPITLNNRLSKIRYTNFVEIMVPLLTRNLLKRVLPLFQLSKSGFGLDLFWARLLSDPLQKCAILDEITVRHTRPVGSVLAKEIKKEGSTGDRELQEISRVTGLDLDSVRPVTLSLLSRAGLTVRGPRLCGLLQFIAHAPWPSARHNRNFGLWVFGGSLYWHFVRKPVVAKITGDFDSKLAGS